MRNHKKGTFFPGGFSGFGGFDRLSLRGAEPTTVFLQFPTQALNISNKGTNKILMAACKRKSPSSTIANFFRVGKTDLSIVVFLQT